MSAIQLKGGEDGRAKVQWSAKGVALLAPMDSFTVPVTAQLVVDDGVTRNCWQTLYAEASKNGNGRFKAKGP